MRKGERIPPCASLSRNDSRNDTERGRKIILNSQFEKGGVGTDKETLLEELWGIATARVTDYMEVKDGVLTVADTTSLSARQKAAIASVEKSTGGIKLKFYDKLKALELLGKYLGLFDSGAELPPSPLLERLLEQTRKEVDTCDLSELQQAADDCHDLVESPPVEAP